MGNTIKMEINCTGVVGVKKTWPWTSTVESLHKDTCLIIKTMS